jgi:hypothetical protein
MKKMVLITFGILLVTNFTLAQKSFKKTYGGDNYERGISVQQTSDKGYVIVGCTRSFGAGKDDVYLIKTDPRGSVQWSNTYGGKNPDNGWAVLQTSDDGFIITGFTRSFGNGDYDVYVVKTDATGKKSDMEHCIRLTSDGGYILAGDVFVYGSDTKSLVYFVKVDKNGN